MANTTLKTLTAIAGTALDNADLFLTHDFSANTEFKISLSELRIAVGNVGSGSFTVTSNNSSAAALTVTQTGTGNSLVVEDSANPDSTPFVITNTGDVGIGTTTPTVKFDVVGAGAFSGNLNVVGAGTFSGNLIVDTNTLFVDSANNVVAIGTATPNVASKLQIDSTTQGFLPPRMTTGQRDAITTPPAGLMIYNTTTNKLNFANGTAWEAVTSA